MKYSWDEKIKECPIGIPFAKVDVELPDESLEKIRQIINKSLPRRAWLVAVSLDVSTLSWLPRKNES